jgi:TRAP-type C4-dicarboxylate transport system permease large subunit
VSAEVPIGTSSTNADTVQDGSSPVATATSPQTLVEEATATESPSDAPLIGGIVGGLVVLLCLIALLVFLVRRKRGGEKTESGSAKKKPPTIYGVLPPNAEYSSASVLTATRPSDYSESSLRQLA